MRPSLHIRVCLLLSAAGGLLLWAVWPSGKAPTSKSLSQSRPEPAQPELDVAASRLATKVALLSGPSRTSAVDATSPQFQACVELLAGANLFDDLPAGLQLLTQIRPEENDSKIDESFARVISAPTPEGLSQFLELCLDEYVARQYDRGRTTPPSRIEASEPSRQLFLRMAIAVEYATHSNAFDPAQADQALWNLGLKRNFEGVGELDNLFTQMIDRRLEQSAADEARWAATPAEALPDDLSVDARSRHWVRALINLRLEDAAEAGDAPAFESLSRRFLAIPYSGEDRDFWTRYDQQIVEKLRARMGAPGGIGARPG